MEQIQCMYLGNQLPNALGRDLYDGQCYPAFEQLRPGFSC